ncbi:MAG: ferredoxin [Desulfobulbaceae bacterium]|nr:ferredoxin [Desulfobulbaceae bacterium]
MAKMVTLDSDECIGCGSCAEICPEVFGFNAGEEKAFVTNDAGGDLECANEAAASCPASCIAIG